MWILCLNDMRSSNIEIVSPVARAETKEALEAFLEKEKTEPYREAGTGGYGPTTWGKNFRKGGPLEWNNPPYQGPEFFQDVGTEDRWASDARQRFQDNIMSLPQV